MGDESKRLEAEVQTLRQKLTELSDLQSAAIKDFHENDRKNLFGKLNQVLSQHVGTAFIALTTVFVGLSALAYTQISSAAERKAKDVVDPVVEAARNSNFEARLLLNDTTRQKERLEKEAKDLRVKLRAVHSQGTTLQNVFEKLNVGNAEGLKTALADISENLDKTLSASGTLNAEVASLKSRVAKLEDSNPWVIVASERIQIKSAPWLDKQGFGDAKLGTSKSTAHESWLRPELHRSWTNFSGVPGQDVRCFATIQGTGTYTGHLSVSVRICNSSYFNIWLSSHSNIAGAAPPKERAKLGLTIDVIAVVPREDAHSK